MNSIKILCVDDDPDALSALVRVLLDQEYEVLTATSGEQALELLEDGPVELVLTDYMMPGINGVALLEQIRRRHPETLGIVLSAYADWDTVAEGVERGTVHTFITKPWNNDQLLFTIRRGLELVQTRQELRRLQAAAMAEVPAGPQQQHTTLAEVLLALGRNASLGALCAGVAHELNNPIAYVQSNLGSLSKYARKITSHLELVASVDHILEGVESAAAQKLRQQLDHSRRTLKLDFIFADLEEVIRQSSSGMSRIQKLVQDLRQLSRERDSSGLLDVNELVESVLNITHNAFKYRTTVERDLHEMPMVSGRATDLGQVLLALLINAGSGLREGGQLKLRTRREASQVVIEICFEGQAGAPAEVLPLDALLEAPDLEQRLASLRLHMARQALRQLDGQLQLDSGGDDALVSYRVCLPLASG